MAFDMIKTADPCGGFIFMIIVIVVIVNFISMLNKAGKSGTSAGGSLFTSTTLGGFTSTTGSPGSLFTPTKATSLTPGGTILEAKTVKRPPINWNLVRLNMDKAKIQECFDVETLSKGIKKKELYKYVYLDKLRSYFSEPQLRDMIDVDFFEESAKMARSESTMIVAPLTEESRVTMETARIKEQSPARPIVEPVKNVVVPERVQEKTFESVVAERTSESIAPEKTSESAQQNIAIDNMALLHDIDPVFEKIACSLTEEQQCLFTKKIMELQECGKTKKIQTGEIVSGLIWSEILKRRVPGQGPGSILSR